MLRMVENGSVIQELEGHQEKVLSCISAKHISTKGSLPFQVTTFWG